MNLTELERSLRQLRLGGMAAVLETRLRQAQAEPMAPIDLVACLVTDELNRRSERLIERRRKQAAFRDPHNTLDNFDFTFNPKMNRSLVFDLATAAFIARREDAGALKRRLPTSLWPPCLSMQYRKPHEIPEPDTIRLRQQGILSPFPVSPKGKPGRGRFPPRRKLRASPRKRDFKALR